MTHHGEASGPIEPTTPFKPTAPTESIESTEPTSGGDTASASGGSSASAPGVPDTPDAPGPLDVSGASGVLDGPDRPDGPAAPDPADRDGAERGPANPSPAPTGSGGTGDPILMLSHADWSGTRGTAPLRVPDRDDAGPGIVGESVAVTTDGVRGGAEPVAPRHLGIPTGALAEQVTLRSAAELADALPYLLGYRPEDSIVLATLHDRHGVGSFGGRARLGIPQRAEDWPAVARQLARCLVSGCERRGARPEGMVAFLCREPERGRTGREVMEDLRPLAQLLRTECGTLDVPVLEALCISDGRFWSYCCPGTQCCPDDGTPMGLPGTSVLSAAMTYAGFQVRGTLKEFRARLSPWETAAALDQQVALDAASMTLAPRILDDAHRTEVAAQTLDLGRRVIERLACARRVPGTLEADLRDDELITHDEAASLILGLQDRTTRDRAAEWMEGEVAAPALRLWRALARRCVGPYGEYAAAPLTLAGWVAWSTGDELEAREALAMALGVNPDYALARLLHQACNEGVGPEAIRSCLRREPTVRPVAAPGGVDAGNETEADAARGAVPDTAPPSRTGATRRAAHGAGPGRTRRSAPRGETRRGPRPTRPGGGRASGPGVTRPPRRRSPGRG